MELTDEQRYKDIVFSVIRGALFGKPVSAVPEADADAVYTILNEHAIFSLAADYVSCFSLSEEDADKWKKQLYRIWMHNIRIQSIEHELLEILQKNGITVAVLKGSAAAYYYPKPQDRLRGDIDIIVAPEEFQKAEQVLSENGYKVNKNYQNPRHKNYSKDSANIELHRYFIGGDIADETTKDPQKEPARIDAANDVIFEALPQTRVLPVGDYTSHILPDTANGFVLLQHIRMHIKTGLGLRQIIDWMMFVNACLDDEAWENGFCELAQKNGLEALAKAVTAMCQKTMGLRTEGISWCACDDQLCRRLADYIFESGNFGRAWDFQQSRSNEIRWLDSPKEAFTLLQSRGERNWKLLEKHPRLKCFAWLYQAKEYTVQMIKHRMGPSETKRMLAMGKERKRLFDGLGV